MIDQRVSEGEMIDFFGEPALTTTLPAQLAIKYNLSIVPVFIERVGEDNFKIEFYDEIRPSGFKDKLELTLGGIKNMSGLPDALFIIDTNKEAIAVLEANHLKIPVIAICDSNSNPSGIDYPIPGNDDALRAISLYCDLVGSSILKGMESNLEQSGVDIGASENLTDVIEITPDVDENNKVENSS